MIIQVNNIRFYLNSQDEELGSVHARMIEDFKDEIKLEAFKQLLIKDSSTAFQIYVENYL
jgi:hypothetical protein